MTDPARNYARALATFICAARDFYNDAGYAATLPHLEALAAGLPNPVRVEVPQPRTPEPADIHPLDRETG